MPDAGAVTGLYGKVPAHGDFVRRNLPASFIGPWDAWLQAGIAAARDRLGLAWEEVWREAPAWRFVLPAGACGPDAVAGVLLPSEDTVGRHFPITIAAVGHRGDLRPDEAWFAAVEALALSGRGGEADADALLATIPACDAVAAPQVPPSVAESEGLDAWLGLGSAATSDAGTIASPGSPAREGRLVALLGERGPEVSEGTTLVSAADPGTVLSAGVSARETPLLARPEGGGWWTLGSKRFPAMVWPLAGLPSPDSFVLLLDSDA